LNRLWHNKKLACVLAGFVLTGCATTEPLTSYYLLNGSRSANIRRHPSGATTVYVRRVDVPAYLTRPGLVTMNAGVRVTYAATAQWAEPLDQGMARAVAEGLSENSRIRAFGFSLAGPPPDHNYEVSIRLERFEGSDTGQVLLRARWSISTSDSSASIANGTTEIRRGGWSPGNYSELVRILGDEVAQMSHQIARAIP
jgi:uncharacterized protein